VGRNSVSKDCSVSSIVEIKRKDLTMGCKEPFLE